MHLQYAEHARWELLRAAGIGGDKLISGGIGPVVLETNINYRRELRVGDEVAVTCEFQWDGGKIFRIHQEMRELDGTVAAEVEVVLGIMDRTAHKPVADPGERLRALAEQPDLLGL